MTSWTDEQLAAFTGGDLDVSDAQAIEEAMTTDGELRARVTALRDTDALLAGLASPTPSAAFSARLRAELDTAVSEVVGDELAARRQRRTGLLANPWLLRGAAAAVAVVAGVGLALSFSGSGDDGFTAAERSLGDEGVMSAETEAANDMAESMMAPEAFTDRRPVVTNLGEVLTDDLLTELAATARDRFGFVDGNSADLAMQNETALTGSSSAFATGATEAQDASQPGTTNGGTSGAGTTDGTTGGTTGGTNTTTTGSADDTSAFDAALRLEGPVDDEDLERVAQCLEPVLEASRDLDQIVIALEARLGERDGVPSIAYFLLSEATDGTFSRIETWVVDRDTCVVTDFITN